MPLAISVVIPAHNEEKYLPACLTALSRQVHAPAHEIIVVDNASTDSTAAIALTYGARVIHEPRKGVAYARQAGFEAARAPIIASTDADTVVPPFWLALIGEHFRADPALGAIYGPVYWPDGNPIEQLMLRYPFVWAQWLANRIHRDLWWGSNFAVRRDVFCAAGGFPVGWSSGEDNDLSLRVSRIAPVRFRIALAVNASSRRSREGWLRLIRRSATDVVRRSVLRRPPGLMPDFR
jgi:glycosyltransferase involved in cell wall biosynthesis